MPQIELNLDETELESSFAVLRDVKDGFTVVNFDLNLKEFADVLSHMLDSFDDFLFKIFESSLNIVR